MGSQRPTLPPGRSGRTREGCVPEGQNPGPIAPGEPWGRALHSTVGRGSPKVLGQLRAPTHVLDAEHLAARVGPVSNSACGPGCPCPWGWAPACQCPAGPAVRCARSLAESVPVPPAAVPAPAPPHSRDVAELGVPVSPLLSRGGHSPLSATPQQSGWLSPLRALRIDSVSYSELHSSEG